MESSQNPLPRRMAMSPAKEVENDGECMNLVLLLVITMNRKNQEHSDLIWLLKQIDSATNPTSTGQ